MGKKVNTCEKIKIGGIEQYVRIKSNNTDNPILLYAHGGPGMSETPMLLGFNGPLAKDFILTTWDQRGAVNSASKDIPKETMNINQFVDDAHELIKILKERFNKQKVFFVGHSWGSVLGMKLIEKYPNDFYAYVGVGQLVYGTENERISYEHVYKKIKEAGDKKGLKKLEDIGTPKNGIYKNGYDSLIAQRKLLFKYGGVLHRWNNYNAFILKYLFTGGYRVSGVIKLFSNLKSSCEAIWDEIMQVNFIKEIPEIKIPVYFVMGRHDYNTPFVIAEEYINKLKAPKKELVWFENSAHYPNFEEPEVFNKLMVEKVKAETYK